MLLNILLLLPVLSQCTNVLDQCANINPYRAINTSAVGKWHLTKGIKIGGANESQNACGFFNTVPPCKCIGVQINTTQSPPSITSYTLLNFGYNPRFNSYANTQIDLTLISKTKSVYNAFVPLANINFTIAIAGTDDFTSWISLIMCDDLKDKYGNSGKLMWIITRSPLPSENVIKNALKMLNVYITESNSTLIRIDQRNCPQLFG